MIQFVKKIHFDRHPKMRSTLLDVVLGWLLQGAAATHLHSLLIQLMMGEADEVEEVQVFAEGSIAKAATAWDDRESTPLEAIEGLLSQHLTAIVDELIADMGEWRAITRAKGGKTMAVLANYAGEGLTAHTAAIM